MDKNKVIIAAATAALSAAVTWGGMATTISTIRDEMKTFSTFKDSTVERLARLEDKEDLILQRISELSKGN